MHIFLPPYDTVLALIHRYSIYKRKISQIKPIAQVSHFLIQTNVLKDEIIRHCDEWRNSFSDLLLEMTTNLIEGFYHYAQTNSIQYIHINE